MEGPLIASAGRPVAVDLPAPIAGIVAAIAGFILQPGVKRRRRRTLMTTGTENGGRSPPHRPFESEGL